MKCEHVTSGNTIFLKDKSLMKDKESATCDMKAKRAAWGEHLEEMRGGEG